MIRLGLRLLTWLDQRFPAKIHVTEEDFDRLDSRLRAVVASANDLSMGLAMRTARIVRLEESVQAIKDAMAKAATPTAAEMHRRAAFIASGRMGE